MPISIRNSEYEGMDTIFFIDNNNYLHNYYFLYDSYAKKALFSNVINKFYSVVKKCVKINDNNK